VAQRYRANLAGVPGVGLPPGWGQGWCSSTCIIGLANPASLMPLLESFHRAGVETRAWWGRGMHTHRAFAGYPRLALPTTERLAETTLGLPFYIDMTPEEVDTVCAVLRRELVRWSERIA
jgi:dTDP-4-amino-4,6-dideoxygalactose transaminase